MFADIHGIFFDVAGSTVASAAKQKELEAKKAQMQGNTRPGDKKRK
jgi:hypothetical protein